MSSLSTSPAACFVVVNYNGAAVIRACLESIMAQDHGTFRVVMVDNGSTDGSPDVVEESFPDVTTIRLERNAGFARANNIALRQAMATAPKFVAFVNNDAFLARDWLSSLIAFMADGAYDSAQAIIADHGDPAQVDSCGIGVSRHLCVYDRRRGDDVQSVTDDEPILGPCFAAALLRSEVLEATGGANGCFDETFDSFYEDVDLCFRACIKGFKGGLLARALCTHRRSFSADRDPFRKYYLLGRNYFPLLSRHVPPATLWRHAPWIVANRMAFLFRTVLHPMCFSGFLAGAARGLIAAIQQGRSRSGRAGDRAGAGDLVRRMEEGTYE